MNNSLKKYNLLNSTNEIYFGSNRQLHIASPYLNDFGTILYFTYTGFGVKYQTNENSGLLTYGFSDDQELILNIV